MTIPRDPLPTSKTRHRWKVYATREIARKTFVRLFQGFVNDYGNVAGEKIIKHIVGQVSGQRLRIPKNDGDPLCTQSSDFRRLWRSTCKEFGQASGRAIMKKIVVELGGRRVRFPDFETLSRFARNTKIRALYNGTNRKELALRFELDSQQIRNIVNDD